MADDVDRSDLEAARANLGDLVGALSGRDRKARQASAHAISQLARETPEAILPYVDEIVDAIERPEAQTRWESIDVLTSLASIDPDAAAKGFEGAESALYDEESGLLRYTAFRYFARLAQSPSWAKPSWALLDEALQCYHGDPEFAGMLDACVELAQADVSPELRRALAGRMSFDAQSGKGPLSYRARQIIELCGR